jgi:arylsulfatase
MLTRLASLMPSPHSPRAQYEFRSGSRTAQDACPPMLGDFVLTADLEVPDHSAGVIAAQGNFTSGWALYVRDGVPAFAYNHLGHEEHVVRASEPLPAGRSRLELGVVREGPIARLAWTIDARPCGGGEIARPFPRSWQIGGSMLRIGYDVGLPVTREYDVPGAFTGTIHSVTFDIPPLGAASALDPAHEVSTAMRSD